MRTIGFWLKHFVFEPDVSHYTSEIRRTPWDITRSGKTIGFSGTTFSHQLNPTSVTQVLELPDEPRIGSTDGRMLCLLLKNTDPVILSIEKDGVYWKQVLHQCFRLEVNALIDTGALMTGVASNRKAAEECLVLMATYSKYRGVIFYEDEWVILSRSGECKPASSSPIQASECFAYYDDIRCRGSDLVLRDDAVGLLTCSQDTALDKVIQGAGRLRQFERSQRLRILISPSFPACDQVIDVIKNCTENSIKQLEDALPIWVARGTEFETQNEKGYSVYQCKEKLADLYGSKLEITDLPTYFAGMKNESSDKNFILQQGTELGKGLSIRGAGSNANGESERESEFISESQEEKEIQIENATPREEVPWTAINDVWDAKTANDLQESLSLKDIASECLSPDVAALSSSISCTSNFFDSVNQEMNETRLRILDNFIRFPDGSILLISEMEANSLFKNRNLESAVTLHNMCYFEEDSFDFTAMKLFNGEVQNYEPVILKEFLKQAGRNQGVDLLVSSRDQTYAMQGSMLQNIRKEIESQISFNKFNH